MALTPEQLRAQALLLRGDSFRVLAHAGAGKTTALLRALRARELLLGEAAPHSLFLGYNQRLKQDAREAAQRLGCERVEVSNYDSVLVRYYEPQAPALGFELAMYAVLEEDRPPSAGLEQVRTLVVDEAQDMTPQFVRFVRKVARDAGGVTQLVLAGDARQSIYDFREASAAYLLAGSAVWGALCPTATVSLTETFRFGPRLCGLLNGVCSDMFGARWEADVRAGLPESDTEVQVWQLSPRGPCPELVDRYAALVRRGLAAGQGVAVLARSVRSCCGFLWRFLEAAHAAGAPRVACEPLPGHPELCTVHASKGREFGTVLLFAAGDWQALPELFYVGCSRARRTLVVVHDGRGLQLGSGLCLEQGIQLVPCGCPRRDPDSDAEEPRQRLSLARRLEANMCAEERMRLLSEAKLSEPTPRPCAAQLEHPLLLEGLRLRMRHAVGASEPGVLAWLLGSERDEAALRRELRRSAGRGVRPLPEALEELACARADVSRWGAAEWTAAARLTPRQHFGHSAVRPAREEEMEAAEALFADFARVARGLRVCQADAAADADVVLSASDGGQLFVFDASPGPEKRLGTQHVLWAVALLGSYPEVSRGVSFVLLQRGFSAHAEHAGAGQLVARHSRRRR